MLIGFVEDDEDGEEHPDAGALEEQGDEPEQLHVDAAVALGVLDV